MSQYGAMRGKSIVREVSQQRGTKKDEGWQVHIICHGVYFRIYVNVG
jgi:hypothetical protein